MALFDKRQGLQFSMFPEGIDASQNLIPCPVPGNIFVFRNTFIDQLKMELHFESIGDSCKNSIQFNSTRKFV